MTNSDYDQLVGYLLYNKNEDLSEGMGEYLFNYFKGNNKNNLDFLNYLNYKENLFKNNVLHHLIGAMNIDFQADNYSYENFIKDFVMFKDNKGLKKSFLDCMNSNMEENYAE